MPISGLVITFADDSRLRHDAISAIREDPRIEIGVQNGSRLAIVIDSESTADDQLLWYWLNRLPGVVFVDVAFVSCEGSDEAESQPESVHGRSLTQTIETSHES